jgi:AcrR family transcriptional regulator
MPRPRFHALPAERQRAILDAAGRAFADRGYAQASLNGVLAEIGVSKGAAYYYFDDKADLFATVVEDAWEGVAGDFQAELGRLDRSTFWPAIEALYARQVASFAGRPWIWRAAKAVGPALADPRAGPVLIARLAPMFAVLGGLRERARELGVFRHDLPEDLVLAMIEATDAAIDGWWLAHPEQAADPRAVRAAFVALREIVEGHRA